MEARIGRLQRRRFAGFASATPIRAPLVASSGKGGGGRRAANQEGMYVRFVSKRGTLAGFRVSQVMAITHADKRQPLIWHERTVLDRLDLNLPVGQRAQRVEDHRHVDPLLQEGAGHRRDVAEGGEPHRDPAEADPEDDALARDAERPATDRGPRWRRDRCGRR